MMLWITANWIALSGFLVALLAAAKMGVKLTPTKTDDAIVDRVAELEKTLEGIFKVAPQLAPTEVVPKVP